MHKKWNLEREREKERERKARYKRMYANITFYNHCNSHEIGVQKPNKRRSSKKSEWISFPGEEDKE